MKLRAEDHITDIESSLATFKSHVSTPKSSTPSSPLSNKDHGPHGKSPLATPEKRTGNFFPDWQYQTNPNWIS